MVLIFVCIMDRLAYHDTATRIVSRGACCTGVSRCTRVNYLRRLRKEMLCVTIHHNLGWSSCGSAEKRSIWSVLGLNSYIWIGRWIDWLAVRVLLILVLRLVLLLGKVVNIYPVLRTGVMLLVPSCPRLSSRVRRWEGTSILSCRRDFLYHNFSRSRTGTASPLRASAT